MKKRYKDYYKKLVTDLATISSCDRLHVGCIIIKNNIIVSTGINGSPSKEKHCDTIGHLIRNGHCIRTIHAEANAIINAAKLGVSIENCEMICSHLSCIECRKLIINSGIKKVYYFNDYNRNDKLFLKNKKVKFVKLK